MASLSVRISLEPGGKIGPGKIDLLEQIAATGSISAAGRQMAMSYRRAWELVEEMNLMFATPLVARQIGGRNGGGASLTPLGCTLVTRYRAIELAATEVARAHLDELQTVVGRRDTGPAGQKRPRPPPNGPRAADVDSEPLCDP